MKHVKKLVKFWMLVGIVGGLMCSGCGNEATTSNKDSSTQGQEADTSQTDDSVKWTFKGIGYTAVTTQAKKDDFFGKPGVTITFIDEKVSPGASLFEKNRVDVFFPQQGTGYGNPLSVAFRNGSEQDQGSRPGGFNGSLIADGDKLSGELSISNMGYDGDHSIRGSFETTLTGP